MSYILDALKKAEQERGLGRVPRLETMHDDAPRRVRTLPWLIAAVLAVNGAALIWWLRPGVHSAATVPIRQSSPAPAPRVVQAAPALPVAPPIARAPTPVIAAPPVAAAPVIPAPSPPPVATSVVPPPAPVAARPVVASAPLLRDLPADFRAAVPSLSLDVHVYAPSAAARFVLINMKKYHEGDQLAEGPRIEQITEEGVVLNYQGQLFRIVRP